VNLIDSEDVSQWEGMVKPNEEVVQTGKFSFELFGKYPTELITKEYLPIDSGKTYFLSAWMRTVDEKLPASAYLGLRLYDENKRPILINNVASYSETETKLAAAVGKGDQKLFVENCPKWLEQKYSAIAFNVEQNLSDLPNRDLSPQVEKIEDEGGRYAVSLKAPLQKDYPVGTPVRLHSPWGAPMYNTGVSGWMPAEWKHFSVSLKGEAQSGNPGNQFWRSTKYARVFVWFGNWDKKPEEGAKLLVDDISFTVE